MRVFITSDVFASFGMTLQLQETFELINPQSDVVYTTNRMQDEPFIEYCLIKGIEFKVLDIDGYINDVILNTISQNIDYLIMFTTMESYYTLKLFEICDKTVILDGERHEYNTAKSIVWKEVNDIEQSAIIESRRKSDLPFNWEPQKAVSKIMRRWGNIPIVIKEPY